MATQYTPRQKHLRRLGQQIRRMEKRGYIFPDDIRETLKQKSTKSLAQLKTPWLYKQAEFRDVETGEVISSKQGRKQERSEAAKKAAQTRRKAKEKKPKYDYTEFYEGTPDESDIVIANLEELIAKLSAPVNELTKNTKGRDVHRWNDLVEIVKEGNNMLISLLRQKMQEEGKENVASRIQENWDRVSQAIEILEYSYSEVSLTHAIDTLAEIINGSSMSRNELASYSAWQEENENWMYL